jgi:hypothetical protein
MIPYTRTSYNSDLTKREKLLQHFVRLYESNTLCCAALETDDQILVACNDNRETPLQDEIIAYIRNPNLDIHDAAVNHKISQFMHVNAQGCMPGLAMNIEVFNTILDHWVRIIEDLTHEQWSYANARQRFRLFKKRLYGVTAMSLKEKFAGYYKRINILECFIFSSKWLLSFIKFRFFYHYNNGYHENRAIEGRELARKIDNLYPVMYDNGNHAEMLLISIYLTRCAIYGTLPALINNGRLFIAVSKYMCLDCFLVCLALRASIPGRNLEVVCQGVHGLRFANWRLPTFLTSLQELFLKVRTIYEILKVAFRPTNEVNVDMWHSTKRPVLNLYDR